MVRDCTLGRSSLRFEFDYQGIVLHRFHGTASYGLLRRLGAAASVESPAI